ncbi:hypothetical protein RYJ27_08320 [Microbacterium limosum]|uniref:Integrase n=1 Tax=Microbacterium limosum TaxID=3079935 RepID=A0AAU0ME03_9MICO|nr:hypothetical protein [Microbacterium sp. Y20]WOQ68720.1 hypothetical protein RYJ27_08320 [Microbacterium sp. Y20]
MLGHVSATMTLDVYADMFADDIGSIAAARDLEAPKSANPNTEKEKIPG